MKITTKYFLMALLLQLNLIFGQNNNLDSLKTYKSNEVVISAVRSEILTKNSPSFVSIISADDITKINGFKLGDKISSSPGVIIKDYGQNNLKTVSIRGMGAEHTLILFNGEKLNSYQNGNFDVNNLIVEDIDRIEIFKGGNSAFYGSDAVGGLINIIPRTNLRDFGAKTSVSIGSYNYLKYYFSIEGKVKDFSLQSSFIAENANNDYEYKFMDGSDYYKGQRQNADFLNRQMSLQFNQKLNSNTNINLINKYLYSVKGVPDIAIISISNARQRDEDLISILSFKTLSIENMEFNISPNFHYSKLIYRDPKLNSGQNIFESKSEIYSYGINSLLKYIFSKSFKLSVGFEVLSIKANSNNYKDSKHRFQISGYSGGEVDLNLGAPLSMILYPALRYDYFSDFGSQVSPGIGLNLKLIDDKLILRANYSKNFRVPTFNELYWNPGGNVELKPERSTSLNLGIGSYLSLFGIHNIEISYFNIYMDDRIIWLPYSGIIWKPKNIQKINSSGLEFSLISRFFDDVIEFNLNYDYTNIKNVSKSDASFDKSLPFIPKHIFKFSSVINFGPVNTGINFDFIGDRYSTELNERGSLLFSYNYLNGFISYSLAVFKFSSNLKFEINNILNSEYVVMPYYPTALRNYRLTFSIQY